MVSYSEVVKLLGELDASHLKAETVAQLELMKAVVTSPSAHTTVHLLRLWADVAMAREMATGAVFGPGEKDPETDYLKGCHDRWLRALNVFLDEIEARKMVKIR